MREMPSSTLRVHDMWAGDCPLLGPSLYVWVQGCPRRCAGCFNQSTLDFDGPAQTRATVEIVDEWHRTTGGLILSGGEPFSQALALSEVCREIRRTHPDTAVLAYSGYELAELLAGVAPHSLDLLHEIDVIVDGPYIRERPTNFPLAGSSNQRVYFLSQRVPASRLERLTRAQIQIARHADGRLRIVGAGAGNVDMHTLVTRFRGQGVSLVET